MKQPHDTTANRPTPEIPHALCDVLGQGLDVKLHLLQHYAELARLLAREILDEEVTYLCGERYSHDKPRDGRYCRWGTNPGSVTIGSERVPIPATPRARPRSRL